MNFRQLVENMTKGGKLHGFRSTTGGYQYSLHHNGRSHDINAGVVRKAVSEKLIDGKMVGSEIHYTVKSHG